MHSIKRIAQITREELRADGYSLVPAGQFTLAPELQPLVKELADEWERLETDQYLKDGSRFRERRYDRFYFLPRTGEVRLRPHRPYFQSEGVNGYAGGIPREVAPLSSATLANPLLTRLLRDDFAHFPLTDDDPRLDEPWDVQCHQFRIISTPDEIGEPTPEGPHRDEVDYGVIHLMGRVNTEGGESQVYTRDKKLVTQFVLTDQMDTMFWADQQILHAVQPIRPSDHGGPAVRDVLIMGYKHSPDLQRIEEV
ncbi:2OG-Fe dioxygenase family protein [Streptomyces sp. NPDC035033]|uniref:2OG-Fe dioxygenase family protein n=1 Tax=Streptomyces sp. NPDC035033 TaxID=3155368 RepID=UPI0033EB0D73